MTNYEEILQRLLPLIKESSFDITILANTSALLYEHLEQINWVGFYIHKENKLLLGPFQGKVACTEIPFSEEFAGLVPLLYRQS